MRLALLAGIAAIAALVFGMPQRMISPGPVTAAHRDLERNCFACHAPFAGAAPERCMACHKIESIGLATTAGVPIRRAQPAVPFHQSLSEKNCLACHGEHAGVRSLPAAHRFSHDLLVPEVRQRCESCHRKPEDDLHRQVTGGCSQCHAQQAWKPATFDHDRYFPLTGEHRAACATCHAAGNYRQYNCYGCHAHTPERVRAEHAEEGVRVLDDCVQCHRSGSHEEGEEREGDD